MYGLWLYKEFFTEYGFAKIEIYERDYNGEVLEIESVAADSLRISLSMDTIISPIGKSNLSFEIINTGQLNYDKFFTPDATLYKLILSTRTTEADNYTVRWSGYIVPDFFSEDLEYRAAININARDNIGYLESVTFAENGFISIRDAINKAFNIISAEYSMSLFFNVQKTTTDGVNILDLSFNSLVFAQKSWYEVISIIFHDTGLQMRWVDNNTIMIYDISLMGNYYNKNDVFFIRRSGFREIMPAWRELHQTQDFGVLENFFDGQISGIKYIKEESVNLPLYFGTVGATLTSIKYYAPENWEQNGEIYTINLEDYEYYNELLVPNNTSFGKRIFFTGIEKASKDLTNYISYKKRVFYSKIPMKIKFNAFNSVLAPDAIYPSILKVYDPTNRLRFMGGDGGVGDNIQLGIRMNVLLHGSTKTYILQDFWTEYTDDNSHKLDFILDKIGQTGDYSDYDLLIKTSASEQDIEITINSIPENGDIEIRIYGYFINEKRNQQEDNSSNVVYDWTKMFGYITDVKMFYEVEETGNEANIIVGEKHNISEERNYIIGQVPYGNGGINTYAGGLFDANNDYQSIDGIQLHGAEYHLLELIGREIAHYNKKNYTRLSGTVKATAFNPLLFNDYYNYNGKKYIPYNYSLSVISNEMSITEMQEIEDYTTESFTEINSQLTSSSGSSISGGGNNVILQYSEKAGNAKRVYELEEATDEELEGAVMLIDKKGLPEAKKYNVAKLAEIFNWFTLQTLENGDTVLVTKHNLASEKSIIWGGITTDDAGAGTSFNRLDSWDNYNADAGDVLSAVLGYGLKTDIDSIKQQLEGGVSGSLTIKIGNTAYNSVDGVVSLPAYPTIPSDLSAFNNDSGYITSDALNGYATKSYVNTAIQDAKDTRVDELINTTIPTLESDISERALQTSLDTTNANVSNLQSSHNTLRSEFDALYSLLNDDTSGVINTWHEVVDFLDEYSGSEDLATILSGMNTDIASRAKQTDLESHIAAYNTFVSSTNTTLSQYNTRIATFEDIIGIDENGDVYIKKNGDTARNFYVYGSIAWGGLGDSEDTSGGSGLIKLVYGYNSLSNTFDNSVLTDTFNAYTIAKIASRIATLESKSTSVQLSNLLSSGTLIGTVTIDGVASNLYAPTIDLSSYLTEIAAAEIYQKALISGTNIKTINNESILGSGNISTYWTYDEIYDTLMCDKSVIYSEQITGNVIIVGSNTDPMASSANIAVLAAGDNSISFYAVGADESIWGSFSIQADNCTFLGQSYAMYFFESGWCLGDMEGNLLFTVTNDLISINNPTSYPVIEFRKSNSILGYIGFIENYCVVRFGNSSTVYGIIHEGNISNYVPANLSSFSNDVGYITGITADDVYAVLDSQGGLGNTGQGLGITSLTKSLVVNALGYTPLQSVTLPTTLPNPYALTFGSKTYNGSGSVTLYAADLDIIGYLEDEQFIYSWAKASTKPSYAFSEITGKPTTLEGYGITNALSTAGGTISGPVLLNTTGIAGLTINCTNSKYSAIHFLNSENGDVGYLGAIVDEEPVYITSGGSVRNLIHSGNILSYKAGSANNLAGVYANENINYGRYNIAMRMIYGTASNSVSLGYPNQYVSGVSVITGYTGWQMVTYGGSSLPNPYFRKQIDNGSWTDWKQLAFLTDNVASAQSLITSYGVMGATVSIDGNVLIGTTTNNGNKLQVSGNISATGSISWGSASDRRLKSYITRITSSDAISTLMRLNPISFVWNEIARSKDTTLQGQSIGFIADEYESIIRNSGRDIWDEYRAIDYNLTIPYLVAGWQNHETRLEILERENNELKLEINRLKSIAYGNS